HRIHVPALRNHVAAAIDHHGQVGFRLFQKISEHPVEGRDVFDCENWNCVHVGRFCVWGLGGSTGIATGSGAPFGASLCWLNLCNRTWETALRAANTCCPVLEIASKLCSRFFPLFKTYSM